MFANVFYAVKLLVIMMLKDCRMENWKWLLPERSANAIGAEMASKKKIVFISDWISFSKYWIYAFLLDDISMFKILKLAHF